MNNYVNGKIAETVACLYMILKGYHIVCRNYVSGKGLGAGEIDFIATRRKTLVFIEVKKRKTLDDASYAISKKQQERIIRGAKNFVKRNPFYRDYDMRFDALLVAFPFYVKHLANAWSE